MSIVAMFPVSDIGAVILIFFFIGWIVIRRFLVIYFHKASGTHRAGDKEFVDLDEIG